MSIALSSPIYQAPANRQTMITFRNKEITPLFDDFCLSCLSANANKVGNCRVNRIIILMLLSLEVFEDFFAIYIRMFWYIVEQILVLHYFSIIMISYGLLSTSLLEF